MKRISSEALKNLPNEVKALVRNGVYSLYTLNTSEASYILVTDRGERYFLSNDGALISGVSVADLKKAIVDVVAFSDPGPDGVMINCA